MMSFPPLQQALPGDYWRIIVAHRWLITWLVVASVGGTAIDLSGKPQLYEGRVVIIPAVPAWEDDQGRPIKPVTANLGQPYRPIKIRYFESISWELQSRVLEEEVINELNLQRHYRTNTMADTRTRLEANRSIQLLDNGMLEVTVHDLDPHMAAAIANAHARQLDRLDRRLLAESAALQRRWLQERLGEAVTKLTRAEEEIRAGSQLTVVAEQKDDTINADLPAQLEDSDRRKQQVMELERELSDLRRFATQNHPSVKQLEARLHALHQAIGSIEESSGRQERVLRPSQDRLPDLLLKSARAARDLEMQTKAYANLRWRLETVSIEASLDMPRVWVLDWALPAERRPKLWQTMLVAGGLALVFGVITAFVLSYLDRLRSLEGGAPSSRRIVV